MQERIRLEEQSKSNASLSSIDQNNSVNANDDVVVAKRRASLVSAKAKPYIYPQFVVIDL